MRKTIIFLILILGYSFLNARELTQKKIKSDQEKNKKKLVSFHPERNRWLAERIAVSGKPPVFIDDYAKRTYGRKWDFTSGTLDGIKGKMKVKDLKLKGSILTFITEEDSEIFWGDHYRNKPEFGEEAIGLHWSSHWAPIRLKMRIKQSLEKSDWIASMRWFGGNLRWGPKRKFSLKGTKWQEVDLLLMDSRFTFVSLGLKTLQPNNHVEIDYVSVYTPVTIRTFKKVIDIKDDISDAAFCVNTAPVFKVYINGKSVVHEEQGSGMKGLLNRYKNMGSYFNKGKNIILVEAERNNWYAPVDSLIMEGMVKDKAGRIYRFQTDKSWQGCYKTLSVKKESEIWKPVKVLGKVKGRFGIDGEGYFLNPPYYGRITATPCGKSHFIFREKEESSIDLGIYGKSLVGNYDIDYKITDSLNGDKEVKKGSFAKDVKPGLFKGKLKVDIKKPGVYDLTVLLKNKKDGEIFDSRVVEMALVGRIEQKEVIGNSFKDGLKLKLINNIDCVNPNEKYPFISISRGKKTPAPIRKKGSSALCSAVRLTQEITGPLAQ